MRIATEEEVWDIGFNVLGLPEYIIRLMLSRHKAEPYLAAHDLLCSWAKQQEDRRQAFTVLHASLRQNKMNELAALLKRWVEGTSGPIMKSRM